MTNHKRIPSWPTAYTEPITEAWLLSHMLHVTRKKPSSGLAFFYNGFNQNEKLKEPIFTFQKQYFDMYYDCK